jgi:hypothetical protein
MRLDFDTFLVALYTVVDDLYRVRFAPQKPNRPGSDPRLSDSEVLTILLCGQWLGKSERASILHARSHWLGYFPKLLSQSQMNRRARDLAGVLVRMVPVVAAELRAELAPYQVLDGLPVPLMRRSRGKRHRLFGDEADIGKGEPTGTSTTAVSCSCPSLLQGSSPASSWDQPARISAGLPRTSCVGGPIPRGHHGEPGICHPPTRGGGATMSVRGDRSGQGKGSEGP